MRSYLQLLRAATAALNTNVYTPEQQDKLARAIVRKAHGIEYGIESQELATGLMMRYVNAGEAYAETLVMVGDGPWEVTSLACVVEEHSQRSGPSSGSAN